MHNMISKTKGLFTLSMITVAMGGISIVNAEPGLGFNEADLPTKYIVKFKQGTPAPFSRSGEPVMTTSEVSASVLEQVKARKIEKLGAKPIYSVEMDDQQLSSLRSNSQVEYVEVDPPRFLLSETTPWGFNAVNAQLLDVPMQAIARYVSSTRGMI